MIRSDWGDWLPREIEDFDPETICLWYLGCNGLVVKSSDGTILYIDPYLGIGDPPRTIRMIPIPFDPGSVGTADAILATHEHTDHVHGPSQAPIMAATGARFFGPAASVTKAVESERWSESFAIDDEAFSTVSIGDTFEVGDMSVSVEIAHDPDAVDPVSYVIQTEDVTILHAGDSKPTDAFEQLGSKYDIDVGILAFGSEGMIPDKQSREPKPTKWYNDENDIIRAANDLRIGTLVPTHWDMWKGLTADPTAVISHSRSFEWPKSVRILEIGDRYEIDSE